MEDLTNFITMGLASLSLLALVVGRITSRKGENPGLLVTLIATVAIVALLFRDLGH